MTFFSHPAGATTSQTVMILLMKKESVPIKNFGNSYYSQKSLNFKILIFLQVGIQKLIRNQNTKKAVIPKNLNEFMHVGEKL